MSFKKQRFSGFELVLSFFVGGAIFLCGRCSAQTQQQLLHNLKLAPGTTVTVTSFYLGRPMLLFMKFSGGEMMRFNRPKGSGSLSLEVVLFGALDTAQPDVDVYLHSDNLYFTLGSVHQRPFMYGSVAIAPPPGIWPQILRYYQYDSQFTRVSVSYCMLPQHPARCDTRMPQMSFLLTELPTLGPTPVRRMGDESQPKTLRRLLDGSGCARRHRQLDAARHRQGAAHQRYVWNG